MCIFVCSDSLTLLTMQSLVSWLQKTGRVHLTAALFLSQLHLLLIPRGQHYHGCLDSADTSPALSSTAKSQYYYPTLSPHTVGFIKCDHERCIDAWVLLAINVVFQTTLLVPALQILMWNHKDYVSIPQESNSYDSNYEGNFGFLPDLSSAIFPKSNVLHFLACNLQNYRLDFHNCCLLGH